jgi:hypothetical protein
LLESFNGADGDAQQFTAEPKGRQRAGVNKTSDVALAALPSASEVRWSKGGRHAARNEKSLCTRRCTKPTAFVTDESMRSHSQKPAFVSSFGGQRLGMTPASENEKRPTGAQGASTVSK